jgi:hypothetical protein
MSRIELASNQGGVLLFDDRGTPIDLAHGAGIFGGAPAPPQGETRRLHLPVTVPSLAAVWRQQPGEDPGRA